MKQRNKILFTAMLWLTSSMTIWAQSSNITISKTLDGESNDAAGEVTHAESDGVCTLTVNPADGKYLAGATAISVRQTIDAGMASARTRSGEPTILAVEVEASGTTNKNGGGNYQFAYDSNCSYAVTVAFLSGASTSVTVDGVVYYGANNGCTVCGKTEPHYHVGDGTEGSGYESETTPTELTIPASIGGLPVTIISDNAFKGCSTLKKLTIENTEGVVKLGQNALSGTGYPWIHVPADKVEEYRTDTSWKDYKDRIAPLGLKTTVTLDGVIYYYNINGYYYAGNGTEHGSGYDAASGRTEIEIKGEIPAAENGTAEAIPVKFVANHAFLGCEQITKVTINDNVSLILGDNAFHDCKNLQEIHISTISSRIPSNCFYGCSSLREVEIPANVIEYYSNAFSGCTNLVAINVNPENTRYYSEDGVLYSKGGIWSGAELLCVPEGRTGNYEVITKVQDRDVRQIDYWAFRETRLSNITIPECVTKMRAEFTNCANLRSVTINGSIEKICSECFLDCPELTTIVFRGTTVPTFEDYLFGFTNDAGDAYVPRTAENALTIYVPNGMADEYTAAIRTKNQEDALNIKELPPTTSAADGIKLYLVMEAAGCPVCGLTEPHYHVGDGTDGSGYDAASAPVDNKLTIPRSVTLTVNGEETEIAVTAIAENAFKGLGLTVVVATDETTGAVITTADGNDRTLSVAPNADENGVISIPRSIDGIDITNLDADVFADKNAKVIDMSATTGLNLTDVDRTAGEEHPLGGIGVNTLVYLPAGLTPEEGSNTDNLVIGDDCSKLLLAEDMIIPKAFNASLVVFGREFKANRTSTIFLPFSISASQASSLGTFHTFTGITSDGKAQFSSAVSGEIASKTPYIFIPQADGKISVDADGGIAIAVTTGSEESTNGQLIGNFKAIEFGTEAGKVSPDGIYGFADANDKNIAAGTFVKVKAGATIAPYRAYLEIANAGARLRFDVCFDDETTGISPVRVNADGYWYSIDGRRLTGKPTVKGTYINNGKKTIIK